MLTINKITSASPIDYAAEELKKYLRMMMPECGDIKIAYNPLAADGFRLGLMQDFGLDVSDAEEPELDDILYIDCDEKGGIIAGDNPRSVLLAVYEYLRQNGCRWLFPGVDGEYIPMQDIKPVKYRHKPSCRYRGWCNEGAEFQQCMMETIDFVPKVGMNVYMLEFKVPKTYYESYYNHRYNTELRPPEPISDRQVLAWKRQCECEIAKRGLQFHDIGHGFTCDPFGIDSTDAWGAVSDDVSEEIRPYLAMIDGKRGLYRSRALTTQFCMSNQKARDIVSDYVVSYARNHENADYLHVWLADDVNNHCECPECQRKTPSDYYVILLNEIDAKLEKAGLSTRIVFISYVDTMWAPLTETIKNPKRFTLLFAPISRSYAYSMPDGREKNKLEPYKRNKNEFPKDLGESFDYLDEWRKSWHGANVAYEYHFCNQQYYDLGGIFHASLINEDVKVYKKNGVNGIIEDGSQRVFFPTGLSFYTYARTLFDTSLSFEEIKKEYFSCAFGEDWRLFSDYLERLTNALPFSYFARSEAAKRECAYVDADMVGKIESVKEITKAGRELIRSHYNSDYRVRTVSVRLLEHHADFCELVCDWMAEKARGENEKAGELLDKLRLHMGKKEPEIQLYLDHSMCISTLIHAQRLEAKSTEFSTY